MTTCAPRSPRWPGLRSLPSITASRRRTRIPQLRDSLRCFLMRHAGMRAIDPERIVAAGDSAGGQMTAALAMWLRDKGLPQLRGQVLIYPVLGTDTGTASNAIAEALPGPAEMEYYRRLPRPARLAAAQRPLRRPAARQGFVRPAGGIHYRGGPRSAA